MDSDEIRLEVIALTVQDAINAENGGAASVEIVRDLGVGGLTPEYDLVRDITESVHIQTHAIVRPHADSFVYSTDDKKQMLTTIKRFRDLLLTSIVIGCMTPDGNFDHAFLDQVKTVIEPQRITVHRVIDHVNDPLADMQEMGHTIHRILCSGAPTNVYDGRERMGKWVTELGDRVSLVCGGGITFENIEAIHTAVKAKMYHTGRAVRTNDVVDSEKVRQMIALLNQ